jgi:1-acyl-sn-glycerol-3-phosphate acyltransferase
MGKLAYAAVGRHAGFLMKEQWFFWPLGCFFRSIGGVAVARKNKRISLTAAVTEMFRSREQLQIAITPEGTRSRTAKWHTGFLHIAKEANVPIVLGVLDYGHKEIIIKDTFTPTGDAEADLLAVKNYYKDFKGKYPEKFTID